MSKYILVAACGQERLSKAIDELVREEQIQKEQTLLISTKAFRVDDITNYLDLVTQNFNENTHVKFDPNAVVIVIQHNQTLISFINVYRFLRANDVSDFSIKACGKSVISTSVETVFASLSADTPRADLSVKWIDPKKLTLRHEFSTAHFGQVIDGDWDIEAKNIEATIPFFESLRVHVEQGVPWPNTQYYQDIMNSLEVGEVRFDCRSKADLDARCELIDQWFADMRDNGFRQLPEEDFITVNVGRDGQPIFNDGRHRLAMAKLLKIDKIPVKIAVRHPLWNEFRAEIFAFAARFYRGEVYAKINHFDLQDIGFSQDDDRLNVITKNMNPNTKSLLDIGSHWGYFCSSFEEIGIDCTAVEGDVSNFYFLDKIRVAEAHHFKAVNQSIFDYVAHYMNFDVVLALNIFHHFIKTRERFEQFKILLSRLDMHEMFLQTHSTDEPQMQNSYLNYDANQFADFVIEHTKLKKKETLVEYENGRVLFKLSK